MNDIPEELKAQSQYEFIITYKYNSEMPNAYNVSFTGDTLQECDEFIADVDKQAQKFMSTYDVSRTGAYLIRELCHMASTSATYLNLNLLEKHTLSEADKDSHIMVFCMAVWMLHRFNVVDGAETGIEASKKVIPLLGEKADTYIKLDQYSPTQEQV